MYSFYYGNPYPYYPTDHPLNMYNYNNYNMHPYPYWGNAPTHHMQNLPQMHHGHGGDSIQLQDYGPEPYVVNIEQATLQNNTFRTALWTGQHLQLTVMNIDVGDDIGLEIHTDHDQFIRIEQGQGLVKMGDRQDRLDFEQPVHDDYAIFVPAGKWHNLINTGNTPLKLYSIYAPTEHPRGTVHPTKADAVD